MNDIQRAWTALFLTRLLIVLLTLGLILAAMGAKAVPPPFPCAQTSPVGLALNTYAFTPTGAIRCVYGLPAERPCALKSADSRTLDRVVIRPNGRVKCFYVFEVTW